MKTIHIEDGDCFIRITPDCKASLNVPLAKDLETEIPDNAKMTVALAHLITEKNSVLDDLIQWKWNELVDTFKAMKNGGVQ